MSNVKKRTKLSRKKVAELSPKEFREHHRPYSGFIDLSPATHSSSLSANPARPHPHRFEKYILMVLLSLAMAAFLGFKLLENSDMTFSSTDTTSQTQAANSLASDNQFKQAFDQNRQEARALVAQHSRKNHSILNSRKGKRLYAKKKTKKHLAHKVIHKKAVAKNIYE